MVVSDSGRSVVDFANVSLGKIKKIYCFPRELRQGKEFSSTETLFFHQSAIHQGYSVVHVNFNSQDLIVNSPLWLIHISQLSSHKNFLSDQDDNFYLISLSILITCLLDNVWIL